VAVSEANRAGREFVALALRLRRLVPELVEVVTADRVVRRAVAAEPVPTAAELVQRAGRLAAELPDCGLDPGRERFLAGQLRAVEWRARRLAGQHVPFAVEVEACLDVAAVPGEPDEYRAVHRELAALLPGSAPLRERLAARRTSDAVDPDRLDAVVGALTAGLRARVASRYGLPPSEAVNHRIVDDGPWSALHTYSGHGRSVVRINAGARPTAGRLPRLLAHETYPGHHVECVRAELAAARGHAELAVTVAGSPWTVLSEGLAECALDTAVGAGWGPWSEQVLAPAGVDTDGRLAERVDVALAALRRVRLDAALLLHGDGRPTADGVEAARAHLRRWLLLDDRRARRVVDALARPLWRTQVVASVEGAALVRAWLSRAGADPVAEHLSLLDAPVVPSALRGRTSTEGCLIYDGR
jgi:hypothetical protein